MSPCPTSLYPGFPSTANGHLWPRRRWNRQPQLSFTARELSDSCSATLAWLLDVDALHQGYQLWPDLWPHMALRFLLRPTMLIEERMSGGVRFGIIRTCSRACGGMDAGRRGPAERGMIAQRRCEVTWNYSERDHIVVLKSRTSNVIGSTRKLQMHRPFSAFSLCPSLSLSRAGSRIVTRRRGRVDEGVDDTSPPSTRLAYIKSKN